MTLTPKDVFLIFYIGANMHPKDKLLIPMLIMLVILPMIATDIYLPVLPAMGEHLGAAGSSLADSLASYMLGYSLSLLLAGVLADIYGRRIISIIGISIFSIASVGCFFASSIEQLVVWRFFQAFGGGSGTLIARIIVRDVYDEQSQVKVLSYLATGLVISPIFGPIIGAFISNYYGWRSIFFILTFISLFILITLCQFMGETLASNSRKKGLQLDWVFSRWLALWGHREFAFNTLVISFAWAIYFSFISSSPILIQNLHKADPIEYGYLFAITISGFIFGAIFIRRKIATCNLKSLIAISGAITLIATLILYILVLAEVGALPVKLFFVFCTLFGIGVIFPATQAGVTRPFQDDIGLISGIFYSTEMFFGAVCGYMLSMIGVAGWEMTSLIMLIAAACIVSLSGLDRLYGANRINGTLKIRLK